MLKLGDVESVSGPKGRSTRVWILDLLVSTYFVLTVQENI